MDWNSSLLIPAILYFVLSQFTVAQLFSFSLIWISESIGRNLMLSNNFWPDTVIAPSVFTLAGHWLFNVTSMSVAVRCSLSFLASIKILDRIGIVAFLSIIVMNCGLWYAKSSGCPEFFALSNQYSGKITFTRMWFCRFGLTGFNRDSFTFLLGRLSLR